jgi:colanic acid biosynthesis glycosyl transferase WcaI
VDAALHRVNRLLVRRADAIVALGESMSARLERSKGADPRKIRVIHNWADCSALVPVPRDNAFSRAHGLGDKFVVMHSGNVGLSQNLDTLLDAAALLRAERGIVFVIVGDGAKRPGLEARAAAERLDNVRFLPFQPKCSLSESFGSADVFVVSLKRGLAGCIVPSKLYGILAAGRPYIAAVEETCEVARLATSTRSGLLAAPGDPRALADRILELYRNPLLAVAMGDSARTAGLEFDRPRQVARYDQLLRQVAGVTAGVPAPAPVIER